MSTRCRRRIRPRGVVGVVVCITRSEAIVCSGALTVRIEWLVTLTVVG